MNMFREEEEVGCSFNKYKSVNIKYKNELY